MSGFTSLPPTIIHSTTSLTHANAHSLLAAFLERANNDAAYRPDSTLTARGPQSTSTATKSDLTLHHLNRIKLGLEGKNLGVEDLENGFLGTKKRKRGDEGKITSSMPGTPTPMRQPKRHLDTMPEVYSGAKFNDDATISGPAVAAQQESNDWQDKDDYELAQGDEDVSMNDAQRHPGARLEQPADAEEEEDLVEIEIGGTGQKVDPRIEGHTNRTQSRTADSNAPQEKISKEERKRRKKERQAEEKRTRAAERSTKS